MLIAMLSSGSCVHSVRWANALAAEGLQVHLLSLHPFSPQLSADVTCHRLRFGPPQGYFLNVKELKKRLATISPDILHTHYASGYGTLGRLSGFHPQILSVWGSDVYDFPTRGRWHRWLINRNLRNADLVCSTSYAMERHVRKLCSGLGEIPITPFGVDTDLFRAADDSNDGNVITIGTVKTLAPKYGVDTLIRGFEICRRRLIAERHVSETSLRLRIVGDGPERSRLEKLADRLGIGSVTSIRGAVPHIDVPSELRKLDIYVAASRLESFGVAILEASACQLPVVVTNVGGLPEVVEEEVTGLLVPKDNPEELAAALCRLVVNPDLREELGRAGAERVASLYRWEESVAKMIDLYDRHFQCGRMVA